MFDRSGSLNNRRAPGIRPCVPLPARSRYPEIRSLRTFTFLLRLPSVPPQIMLGEGLMYCMQARLRTCPKSESSINAGGCSFNSFLRRTVRFVGTHDSPDLMPLLSFIHLFICLFVKGLALRNLGPIIIWHEMVKSKHTNELFYIDKVTTMIPFVLKKIF